MVLLCRLGVAPGSLREPQRVCLQGITRAWLGGARVSLSGCVWVVSFVHGSGEPACEPLRVCLGDILRAWLRGARVSLCGCVCVVSLVHGYGEPA